MSSMGMSGWWTSGGTRRRCGGWPRRRSSGCCGCIGSGIGASMCGTFIRSRAGSTASRVSYSFVKQALQAAGLVPKHRARGRHRRRREPRACFGELLHLDGSPHAWLALVPELRATLIAVVDDATKRLLYAQLEVAESTQTVMQALRTVFTTWGLPMALYTDRASWAFLTPKANGPGGQDARHPGGPGLGAVGHRAHPGVLAASAGPQ